MARKNPNIDPEQSPEQTPDQQSPDQNLVQDNLVQDTGLSREEGALPEWASANEAEVSAVPFDDTVVGSSADTVVEPNAAQASEPATVVKPLEPVVEPIQPVDPAVTPTVEAPQRRGLAARFAGKGAVAAALMAGLLVGGGAGAAIATAVSHGSDRGVVADRQGGDGFGPRGHHGGPDMDGDGGGQFGPPDGGQGGPQGGQKSQNGQNSQNGTVDPRVAPSTAPSAN